ncbi:MAG: hypothetical protein HY042_05165 [Spirochaetia bacterium]|nr:hypothetical protein [Spirochaetia bacterium]
MNGPRYVSCADVQAQSPGAPDGDYLLTLPGGSVSVYCYNMAASPKEYLTFQNCNANGQPNANSSLYAYSATGNQNVTPGGLWTYYNRVRFNPTNLTIDQTDRTFSTNNGGDRWFGATHFSNNDYADAGSCGCDGTLGTANIDMTGLPFTVVQGQFAKGADPTSYMNYSPDNKIVNLGGGGCCGATNTLGNPIQLSW